MTNEEYKKGYRDGFKDGFEQNNFKVIPPQKITQPTVTWPVNTPQPYLTTMTESFLNTDIPKNK